MAKELLVCLSLATTENSLCNGAPGLKMTKNKQMVLWVVVWALETEVWVHIIFNQLRLATGKLINHSVFCFLHQIARRTKSSNLRESPKTLMLCEHSSNVIGHYFGIKQSSLYVKLKSRYLSAYCCPSILMTASKKNSNYKQFSKNLQ